jgi:hypothetical protein
MEGREHSRPRSTVLPNMGSLPIFAQVRARTLDWLAYLVIWRFLDVALGAKTVANAEEHGGCVTCQVCRAWYLLLVRKPVTKSFLGRHRKKNPPQRPTSDPSRTCTCRVHSRVHRFWPFDFGPSVRLCRSSSIFSRSFEWQRH